MQVLDGTLVVEAVNGQYGSFNVGILKTSIGEFKIKDAALDQFKAGVFEGRFTIDKIYVESKPWRNGIFTNLMVKIAVDGYQIAEENDGPAEAPSAQAEPDAIDVPVASDKPISTEPAISESAQDEKSSRPEPEAANSENLDKEEAADPDEELFGVELYSKFSDRVPVIELDTTVDRVKFRMQIGRLKDVGYSFDSLNQVWRLANKT